MKRGQPVKPVAEVSRPQLIAELNGFGADLDSVRGKAEDSVVINGARKNRIVS